MHIFTDSGNVYSYIRESNEIVGGVIDSSTIPWNFKEFTRFSSMDDVNMYILSITEQCNLRCRYCCYSGNYINNRTHSVKSMSNENIDSIFDFIDRTSSNRNIRVSFYGGESLLHFPFIKMTVAKGYARWGSGVVFAISTNGTLLTEEVIDWLVENRVECAVSIDGPAAFHDKYRTDVGGVGSFARIYKALSYIKNNHTDYISMVTVVMTMPEFKNLEHIAQLWHSDPILCDLTISMINALAPNFSQGVEKVEYDDIKGKYARLLNIYEEHPDWNILRVFFNQCLAYWKNRPILTPTEAVPMATCIPNNTKLYIDADLQIGVCEKISDNFRMGNVVDGINWDSANNIVLEYYNKRRVRCEYCPVVRMCDMCLKAIEFNDEEWEVLCHNERVFTQVYMYIFCEMAERGML